MLEGPTGGVTGGVTGDVTVGVTGGIEGGDEPVGIVDMEDVGGGGTGIVLYPSEYTRTKHSSSITKHIAPVTKHFSL